MTIPIYVFYYKGPQIRRASKFAQTLAHENVNKGWGGGGKGTIAGGVEGVGEKAQAGHLEDAP